MRLSLFASTSVLLAASCAEPGDHAGRFPQTTTTATGPTADAADAAGADAEPEPGPDPDVAIAPDLTAAPDTTPDIAPDTMTDDVATACAGCTIDGSCWLAGDRPGGNRCAVCDPDRATTGWSPDDGLKCSDGDPCTEGERCAAGACTGGTPIFGGTCGEAPPPDDACTTHYDCYPERVCARWRGDGERHCSTPCASSSQCAAGEVCAKLPGAANVGYCEPTPPTLAADGAACDRDETCASGACIAGLCRAICFAEAACSAHGESCSIPRDGGSVIAQAACMPPGGLIANGAICTADGGQSYGGWECRSGHCDLMPYPDSMVLPCASLCASETDCGPSQECGVVVYGETVPSDEVAYHPDLQTPTYDAVTACFTPPIPGGGKQPGDPCTAPEQCGGDKCVHLVPNDAQRYCTQLCSDDSQCPSDMRCKLDTLTLASPWFQSPYITAQPVAPGAWTLVRACKFE